MSNFNNGGELPAGLGIIRNATGEHERLVTWPSKGGYLPGPPQPVKLKDGERIWVKEGDDIVEYEHQVDNHGESWRLVKVGKIPNRRKRKPIVKVRRNDIPIGGDVLTIKSWEWECHICKQTSWSLNWWTTQNSATRHARNHH